MASPYATFAAGVLRGIGAPVTRQNIAGFIGWSMAEGPLGSSNWKRNNPLNTTESRGASGSINSAGVRIYPNMQTGVAATVQTLKNGNYGGILGAFRSGNVRGLAGAIGSSPWGTSGSLAASTISQALQKNWGIPGQSLPGPSGSTSGPGATSVHFPGYTVSSPASVFDQSGFMKAQRAEIAGNYLQQNQTSPFDIGPKIPGLSTGSASLIGPKLLSTAAANPADYMNAVSVLQHVAGQTLQTHPGAVQATPNAQGYINPISGASLGRTDEGVDATLPAGHPIVAIGDSRVVGISPNWYRGQPYVLFQLTSGPAAGRYYYIAEAINPTVRPGQRVRRGQVVGHYNAGGTGLELGWGTSTPGVAAAASHYSEGQVTAEGTSFRNFLHSLH